MGKEMEAFKQQIELDGQANEFCGLKVFEQQKTDLEARANEIVVSNNEQYEQASEFCKGIKTLAKGITDYFEPMVSKAYSSWKELTTKKKEQLDPLEVIEKNIKSKMDTFYLKQQQEIQRQQRELETKKRQEEEAIAKELREQEKKGNEAKAEELRQKMAEKQAEIVIPVTVQAKVSGTAVKEVWDYKVEDISKVERKYLIINDDLLSKLATATKGKLEVKGIQFFSKLQTSISIKGQKK